MCATQSRVPAGVSTGGRFASTQHAEPAELAVDPTPKTWEQRVEHGRQVAKERGIDLEPIAGILRSECRGGITSDQTAWGRISIRYMSEHPDDTAARFKVKGSDLWEYRQYDPGHGSDADDVLTAGLDQAWADR